MNHDTVAAAQYCTGVAAGVVIDLVAIIASFAARLPRLKVLPADTIAASGAQHALVRASVSTRSASSPPRRRRAPVTADLASALIVAAIATCAPSSLETRLRARVAAFGLTAHRNHRPVPDYRHHGHRPFMDERIPAARGETGR